MLWKQMSSNVEIFHKTQIRKYYVVESVFQSIVPTLLKPVLLHSSYTRKESKKKFTDLVNKWTKEKRKLDQEKISEL